MSSAVAGATEFRFPDSVTFPEHLSLLRETIARFVRSEVLPAADVWNTESRSTTMKRAVRGIDDQCARAGGRPPAKGERQGEAARGGRIRGRPTGFSPQFNHGAQP